MMNLCKLDCLNEEKTYKRNHRKASPLRMNMTTKHLLQLLYTKRYLRQCKIFLSEWEQKGVLKNGPIKFP